MLHFPFAATLVSSLLFTAANARILTNLNAVASKSYDFVIVGGGAGGSLMANRLSASGKYSVILIEAGESDLAFSDIGIPVPLLSATLTAYPQIFWNTTTTPQPGLGGRSIPFGRAKVLGGGTSVNLMVVNKGSVSYWNRLATTVGDASWSWAALKAGKYLTSWETLVAPQDDSDLAKKSIPGTHGTSGPVQVTYGNWEYGTDQALRAAIPQSPDIGITFNQDVNAGDQVGLGYTPSATGHGIRSSAPTAFLYTNNVVNRSNLDILLGAQVTKLLFDTTKSGISASGVFYSAARGEQVYSVRAKKEVILAAGAVGSPQVLLLRRVKKATIGVGDKAELKAKGIGSVLDVPLVGRNLQDHPAVPSSWTVNTTKTWDPLVRNQTLLAEELAAWSVDHKGILGTNLGSFIGFWRLPSNDSVLRQYKDIAGPTEPHAEYVFVNGFLGSGGSAPTTGNYQTVVHEVLLPKSRGSVSLASSDPFTEPLYNPNFLGHPLDRHVVTEVIKNVRRFFAAPAWKGLNATLYGPPSGAITDEEIDTLISETAASGWHACGTLAMSPFGDNKKGVTNPDFTFKGISHLSVVDTSIFPDMPSGHPMGFLYTAAEKAAKLTLLRAN